MNPIGSARALALLERATGVRILVVGDLMLDRYISGEVERISPEAPVPVVRVRGERTALGGAGNVAAHVTALGATCDVVGHVGADAEGALLMRALDAHRIGSAGVVRGESRPTTVKTRVLAKHQQIVRFDRESEGDLQDEPAQRLAACVCDLAAKSDVMVVQDYNKGVFAPAVVEVALGAAVDNGIPSVVDPKRRGFFAYSGATVFKPNARELGDALGEPIHPEDAVWMEATRCRLRCEHLLVTLGDRGMALQTAGGKHLLLPTMAQAVFDVSGAGDTVTAVVAVALAVGADAGEAASLANHAAAVAVGKAGVQTVTAAEVAAHVRAHPDW